MISRSKLVTLLLTGALVVGVGVAGIVGPAAASGPGTAYVTPGAGNPVTTLTVNTTALCPAGDTNGDVTVSGSGITTHTIIAPNSALPTAGSAGYLLQLTETLSTFASEQSPPATLSGAYVFSFNCFATATSLSPDESFTGTIMFQGSGNDSTNTYTNTATTLAASPSGSAASGSNVTFTATMSPANAAGQVQFMDGTTDLGAPVTVSGGQAVYETSALVAGSHSLTATFGPLASDSSGSWGPSASAALPYTITGTGTGTGTDTDYVTPGVGNAVTTLTINTNGFCPAGNTNADITVFGTGVTTHTIIAPNSPLPQAGPTGYWLPLTETMSTFASEQNPGATLSGAYTFSFNCFASRDVPQLGRELHGHHHVPGLGQRQHEHLHQHGNDVGGEPERFCDLR